MAFIVFEGGDGAGKSTQARALVQRLRRRSYPVTLTREPGGTPLGESLRRILKSHQGLSSLSELLLFAAARAQLTEEAVHPALQSGGIVICDRFTASTVAYQGYGRGLDLDLIHQLNQLATGGLSPDLTILLDLPAEVSLTRIGRADGDAFHAAPQEFHEKVRQGYLSQAAQDPARWLVLDAARPRRELSREIWAKVQPLL
jgi:dTMP kinase